jgi:hypothetical protein
VGWLLLLQSAITINFEGGIYFFSINGYRFLKRSDEIYVNIVGFTIQEYSNILSCVRVIIDGAWIGDSI